MYACYLYGLFSVFRLQPLHAFFVNPCHSWIKIAASPNTIWIRFGNRRAIRRRVEPGMALTAIGEVSQWGGVADWSGCRTIINTLNTIKANQASPKLCEMEAQRTIALNFTGSNREWRNAKSVTPINPRLHPRGLQCFKLNGNHTENDRYCHKNNFLLFAKCLQMYSFFRICILRLQKVLLWPKFFFLQKISIWVSKNAEFYADFKFVDADLNKCP